MLLKINSVSINKCHCGKISIFYKLIFQIVIKTTIYGQEGQQFFIKLSLPARRKGCIDKSVLLGSSGESNYPIKYTKML